MKRKDIQLYVFSLLKTNLYVVKVETKTTFTRIAIICSEPNNAIHIKQSLQTFTYIYKMIGETGYSYLFEIDNSNLKEHMRAYYLKELLNEKEI